MVDLGPIVPSRKNGDESFHANGAPIGARLSDFWQWSASDLISNAQRGVLAEFLVAKALGVDGGVRTEWDAYDLRTEDEIKIEVKSSGYVQSWHQEKLSNIGFDIAPKLCWDASTNTSAQERTRPADVYVFAVHAQTEQRLADPLNIKQWEFFVVPTSVLNSKCAGQKRISLTALRKLAPIKATFGDLKSSVRGALGG